MMVKSYDKSILVEPNLTWITLKITRRVKLIYLNGTAVGRWFQKLLFLLQAQLLGLHQVLSSSIQLCKFSSVLLHNIIVNSPELDRVRGPLHDLPHHLPLPLGPSPTSPVRPSIW